ncbi:MAG: protein-L-isoaspartate(D-aspartate) O-methyltransferase [Magnetococcales bacterium]|nr:protein-L-isoaspartate(D-aspartate) O-methyltransferase [Magnetococcales bacterium]
MGATEGGVLFQGGIADFVFLATEAVRNVLERALHQTRLEMVTSQLAARGIQDARVLEAMGTIPRECFVSPELESLAYWDGPLVIGHGQTISQPFMVAAMAASLVLQGDEVVLEVGAGSGYGAAVLSRLARQVVAVERIPELLEAARARWSALGLDNITGVLGDGTLGVPEWAPFDGICVTAAAPRIPPSLLMQLCPDQGRMIIPLGARAVQQLCLVRRVQAGEVQIIPQFACRFVPLLGEEGWDEVHGPET